jgi:glutamate-1-semialdehyde 2,1-aminomutase
MPTSSQTLYLNKNCKQVPPAVVAKLLSEERSLYLNRTKNSKIIFEKTSNILPLGVPSSFQYYPPYPISIKSAQGAYLFDLDENKYLDLSMGFGAL